MVHVAFISITHTPVLHPDNHWMCEENEVQEPCVTLSQAGDRQSTWPQTQTRTAPKPAISLFVELRPCRKGGKEGLGGDEVRESCLIDGREPWVWQRGYRRQKPTAMWTGRGCGKGFREARGCSPLFIFLLVGHFKTHEPSIIFLEP